MRGFVTTSIIPVCCAARIRRRLASYLTLRFLAIRHTAYRRRSPRGLLARQFPAVEAAPYARYTRLALVCFHFFPGRGPLNFTVARR